MEWGVLHSPTAIPSPPHGLKPLGLGEKLEQGCFLTREGAQSAAGICRAGATGCCLPVFFHYHYYFAAVKG